MREQTVMTENAIPVDEVKQPKPPRLSWKTDRALIKFLSSQMPGLPWESFSETFVKVAFFALVQAHSSTFGGKMRLLRKAKGLTLPDVTAQTGISLSLMSSWENGTLPNLKRSADTLFALVDLYGVESLKDFLPYDEKNLANLIPILSPEDFEGASPTTNAGVTLATNKRHEKGTEYLNTSEFIPLNTFAFKAPDDSMSRVSGKSIPCGSTVIVSIEYKTQGISWLLPSQTEALRLKLIMSPMAVTEAAEKCNGKVVCCAFNCGPAMLRELFWDNEKGEVTLKAWNPNVKQEPPFKPAVAGGRGMLFAIYGIVEKAYENF